MNEPNPETTSKSAPKTALVTGASRGIGQAIALTLAKQGYQVWATSTTEAGAQNIQAALADYAGKGVCLDVNDAPACEALIAQILQSDGAIHALVNNAGIVRDQLSMRMRDEEWLAVIQTNLSAVFRLSRLVTRPMLKQRQGRIVNITSVVGSTGNPGQANYAAAKAGVAGMTKSLAQELGNRNITVNCVAPGFIATDMTNNLSAEQSAALLTRIPLGRLGQPQDVAHAVAFLCSDQANYITGTTLHVNGGMYM